MPKGSFWYPERRKWLINCLSMCDGLMTTSKLIAYEYKEFIRGSQIVLIDTAVDPNTVEPPRNSDDGIVKIVVAASEWHVPNFNQFVKPIVPKLFERFGKKIEFYFVGLHPKMDQLKEASMIHYVPPMSMHDYAAYMRTHKFDLGLGILKPNHFAKRKYFNKFIEYTRYGICGVYSKCMPYELVIEDGVNGFFADNSADAWYKTICHAVSDEQQRKKCVQNAQDYLKIKHSQDYLFQKMVKDMPELVEFVSSCNNTVNQSELRLYQIREIWFRICESIYLTFSSISHYGIGTTIEKIMRKCRGGI